ncbi:ribonuclease S-6-like [Solanum dulcamara]|uniref:ribonuclease S-6-like n=2 Tax=Solanum dulcamara TaxID=45834 RepID=UPI002486AD9F|nr:ribonuclease S-6-like [Solanum dulcamara]
MKKMELPFFFLVLILLLEITFSVESQNPALLKYVLEWPPTFCIQLNHEKEGWCKVPIPYHQFTLHGLMPADEEGFSIKYCSNTEPNWNALFESTRDELVTFWPSLREDFNETEFWKRQWRAHGSCAGTTPEEYFHKAIHINHLPEHGNLFNYLIKRGIFPSDHRAYRKEDIVKAIQSVFDEFPSLIRQRSPPRPSSGSPSRNIYLSCVPTNHGYILSEVTLCTNLEGTEYISCPLEADPASCPDEIMLPLPNDQIRPYLPLMDKWKKPMGNI